MQQQQQQQSTPTRGSVIGGTFDANSLPAITPQSAHIETIDIPESFGDDEGGKSVVCDEKLSDETIILCEFQDHED